MDQIVLQPEPKILEVGAGAPILDAWSWSPKIEFRPTALLSPIVDDIKFNAINEVSFVGTEEDLSLHPGFFLQLMKICFKKDVKLLKFSRSIPNNEK